MSELIQVKELVKAFGDNQVLNGITTNVKRGEVVVVIGPSGSGKDGNGIPILQSLSPQNGDGKSMLGTS